MPAKQKILALSFHTLARSSMGYSLLLPVALTGCGGSSNGSDESGTDTVVVEMDKSDATQVMAQRLFNPEQDVQVQVGFSPLVTLTCDNLGDYPVAGVNRKVCQIYDETGPSGVPTRSPDGVDLVSRIPAGDASMILGAVDEDLQNAAWAPVMTSAPLVMGDLQAGQPLSAQFQVQSGNPAQLSGSCDIKGAAGQISATSPVTVTSTQDRLATLTLSDPGGFGLLSGTYTVDCRFTENSITTSVPGVVTLQVLHANTPPTRPQGVTLENAAGLLKTAQGIIRDVNGNAFCVTFSEPGADAEDALQGLPVTTEGFSRIDDVEHGPLDLAGGNRFCVDISEAGGKEVEAGFKSKDSEGAYSSLAAVLQMIDTNEPPTCSFNTSPSYSQNSGTVALGNESQCTDPEGDSITLSGHQFDTSRAAGTYRATITATDFFKASRDFSVNVTVNRSQTDGTL